MSSLTLNLSVGGVFPGNHLYATLGVAAGELTIISLPLMYVRALVLRPSNLRDTPFSLLYDMAQEKSYSATIVAELAWLGTSCSP